MGDFSRTLRILPTDHFAWELLMLRSLRSVAVLYDRAVTRRPRLMKGLTTGSLMGVGDILSQVIENRGREDHRGIDWKRTLRMGTIGLSIGPVLHYWFGFLERVTTATGTRAALIKLAYDQFLFAPFMLAVVTSVIGASEGKSLKQLKQDLILTYLPALKMNYYIWPAANYINFAMVPTHLRVLYVSSISVGWNAILSNITHQHTPEGATPSSIQAAEEAVI